MAKAKQVKESTQTEGQIQAEILEAIGAIHGVQVMRINAGVFNDDEGNRRIRSVPKGTPDILCCIQVALLRRDQIDSGSMRVEIPRYYTFGQLVWMEVKMPDKMLTVDQDNHFQAWRAAGAACFRVTSAAQAVDILTNIKDSIEITRAPQKYSSIID